MKKDSNMTIKREKNNWDVTINDVVKVNADAGDTLLVALPEQSMDLPASQLDDMFQRVAQAFEQMFKDKDVKVIVVPYGMEVQIIKSSELKDKDDT